MRAETKAPRTARRSLTMLAQFVSDAAAAQQVTQQRNLLLISAAMEGDLATLNRLLDVARDYSQDSGVSDYIQKRPQ